MLLACCVGQCSLPLLARALTLRGGDAEPMAFMRGEILPLDQAKLSVNDWGVVHSDICYDVVPVCAGGFFRLHDYIDRFLASAGSLHMNVGMNREELQSALCRMVARSGLRDAYVAMVCSRGVPLIPGSRDPRDCGNHFYAWCVPYVEIIKPEVEAAGGATALIAKSVRRTPPTSFDPKVKNYREFDTRVATLPCFFLLLLSEEVCSSHRRFSLLPSLPRRVGRLHHRPDRGEARRVRDDHPARPRGRTCYRGPRLQRLQCAAGWADRHGGRWHARRRLEAHVTHPT